MFGSETRLPSLNKSLAALTAHWARIVALPSNMTGLNMHVGVKSVKLVDTIIKVQVNASKLAVPEDKISFSAVTSVGMPKA